MPTDSQIPHFTEVDIGKNRYTQMGAVPVTASKIAVPVAVLR
jgi:hypothetical protein